MASHQRRIGLGAFKTGYNASETIEVAVVTRKVVCVEVSGRWAVWIRFKLLMVLQPLLSGAAFFTVAFGFLPHLTAQNTPRGGWVHLAQAPRFPAGQSLATPINFGWRVMRIRSDARCGQNLQRL